MKGGREASTDLKSGWGLRPRAFSKAAVLEAAILGVVVPVVRGLVGVLVVVVGPGDGEEGSRSRGSDEVDEGERECKYWRREWPGNGNGARGRAKQRRRLASGNGSRNRRPRGIPASAPRLISGGGNRIGWRRERGDENQKKDITGYGAVRIMKLVPRPGMPCLACPRVSHVSVSLRLFSLVSLSVCLTRNRPDAAPPSRPGPTAGRNKGSFASSAQGFSGSRPPNPPPPRRVSRLRSSPSCVSNTMTWC